MPTKQLSIEGRVTYFGDCKSPSSAPADYKSAGTGINHSIIAMANNIQQVLRYIKKAYYRLFYFFFRIEKRSSGKNEIPDGLCAFIAILPLCLFGFIDLMVLEYLFSRFIYNLNISHYKAYGIIIALIADIFNVVLFFQGKRYLKIKEMFSNEDDDTRKERLFYCILYSLITMFGSIILIRIFGYPT